MDNSKPIHQYTKPPREAFWRGLYIIVLLIGAVIGAYFALAPVYYFIVYQHLWILFFFPLVLFGIWMAYRVLKHLRKLMWEDRHLSSYSLYEEKIETTEWLEAYSPSPVERVIPLADITSVIASFYIVRETVQEHGFHRPLTETGPILYIRYTQNGEEQILNLLFPNHQDPNINVWLKHFQQAEIPLAYTAHQLYRVDTQVLTDEQRLEYFNNGNVLVDFPFSHSWLADEANVRSSWLEASESFIEAEEQRDPAFKKQRQKHTFRVWIPSLWFTSLVLMSLVYGYTKIGAGLPVSPANILPGLVIFTAGGFLFFFFLRRYLRWFYMLPYLALVLIIGFWILIVTVDQTRIVAEIGQSLCLAAIVYPIGMAIPYFSIKALQKKKLASVS